MKAKVLELRPTQYAVGMLEIDEKIKEVTTFSKSKLKAYIKENPVPVVKSHEGYLYIVDKHHFLSVCYHLGIKKVRVKLVKDFSEMKISYTAFWKWMAKSRNTYPFCQFGEGPRDALYLPHDIRGLADDPYRSIAWFVRKAGAFDNSEKNFAEFHWANFFRSKNLLKKYGRDGLPKALEVAVKLSQSPEAKKLPGYGKLNLDERIEVQKKARKKGKAAIE